MKNLLLFLIFLAFTCVSHSQFKLNTELPENGDVIDSKITPDGNTVIYVAGQNNSNTEELFSVPISGGTSTRITEPFSFGRKVTHFKISPDGNTIVYRADKDVFNKFELYSIPISGGTSTKISGSLASNLDVVNSQLDFEISPNSNTVVFLADKDGDGLQEVYSTPINAEPVVKLSQTDDRILISSMQISPDSNFVFYLSDLELYSIPINGGVRVKLNEPRANVGGQLARSYDVSSDSNFVLYRHLIFGIDDNEYAGVYIVPVNGGNQTKITGTGITTDAYQFTPNDKILYFTGVLFETEGSFYTVDLNGVDNLLELNSTPITTLFKFVVTPDSDNLIFLGNDENLNRYVFSLPLNGGVVSKISDDLVSGGVVSDFKLSPSGNSVVFIADREVDNINELYEVPTIGGTIRKINGELVTDGDVDNDPFGDISSIFNYSNDESYIVYLADQDTDDVFELYSFSTNTIWSSNLNSTTNFIIIDSDLDTFNWTVETSRNSSNNSGFNGSRFFSESRNSSVGDLTPDNLLITPPDAIVVPLGATSITFKLNVEASNASRPEENFAIYVFDEAVGQSFNTKIYEETLTIGGTGTDKNITTSIPSSFAGKNIGIIVRHYNCTGQERLYIDNFEVSYIPNSLSTNDIYSEKISLYPNPTKDKISLNIKEDITYILTNITGQLIDKGTLSQYNNTINMSHLFKGLYFLSLKNQHIKITKKIIKK